MSNHILNSYRMPDRRFKTLTREVVNDRLFLTVAPRWHYADCPECRERSHTQYDTRAAPSQIKYGTWYGHTVYLCLKKRRFLCRNSGCAKATFTEVIPAITEPYQRSAALFQKQCLTLLRHRSFAEVQAATGASHTYLVKQLNRHVKTNPSSIDWAHEMADEEYMVMGIDEHSHKKKRLVLTITNITKGRVITILPNYSQQEVERFLRSIPSVYRRKIKFVAMDLTNRYAPVVKRWLPAAAIVVDHFHLIRLANQLLWNEKRVIEGVFRNTKVKHFKLLLKGQERLTVEERQKVEQVLAIKQHDRLKMAYELKEELRTILRMKNTELAVQLFLRFLRKDVWSHHRATRDELMTYSKYFRTFVETLQRYQEEIIAFIRTRITNAFTEGVHNKIKVLKRISYGISNISTYINRMILALNPQIIHQLD